MWKDCWSSPLHICIRHKRGDQLIRRTTAGVASAHFHLGLRTIARTWVWCERTQHCMHANECTTVWCVHPVCRMWQLCRLCRHAGNCLGASRYCHQHALCRVEGPGELPLRALSAQLLSRGRLLRPHIADGCIAWKCSGPEGLEAALHTYLLCSLYWANRCAASACACRGGRSNNDNTMLAGGCLQPAASASRLAPQLLRLGSVVPGCCPRAGCCHSVM
ncbi:hypothetical protein COO60DRAFT_924155 [Scenedesmus sp. NREL 46B-D3]|nr:hypothetical protein COO60DRAFT_924155 [Scenedesmus sp. NREL 46B-D3]